MKATRSTISFLLLAALPLGVAFRPASEKLNLTPRFEAGQSYTSTSGFTMDGALDELSVMMDGSSVIDGGAFVA